MSLADLIRKGPAAVARPAGEVSQLSQVSPSQTGQKAKTLHPSARQTADVSQVSQLSPSQTAENRESPVSSPINNNNSKVIFYRALRARGETEIAPFATATVATLATVGEEQAISGEFATATVATVATVARLWDIRTPGGWLEVATCPPASLAMMQARYPEALEILPAPEEEDPGTAFYRRLFAGMDAPRASITLSPEEAHQGVLAGLVTPEDTRTYTLLAYRTPEGFGLMAIDKARWDGMQFLEILTTSGSLQ